MRPAEGEWRPGGSGAVLAAGLVHLPAAAASLLLVAGASAALAVLRAGVGLATAIPTRSLRGDPALLAFGLALRLPGLGGALLASGDREAEGGCAEGEEAAHPDAAIDHSGKAAGEAVHLLLIHQVLIPSCAVPGRPSSARVGWA